MKTFSEAVADVLIKKNPTKADEFQLQEAKERYDALHEEIQNSDDTEMAVIGFMAYISEIPIPTLLAIAFSHGVMVGVEMAEPDLEKMFAE
jgi:hypothetical protein